VRLPNYYSTAGPNTRPGRLYTNAAPGDLRKRRQFGYLAHPLLPRVIVATSLTYTLSHVIKPRDVRSPGIVRLARDGGLVGGASRHRP